MKLKIRMTEQNYKCKMLAEDTSSVLKPDMRDVQTLTKIIGEPYEGEYEVTPSNTTQMLFTADKTLLNNVIVNPIPQNYGLITWNGSTLTVS